MTIPLTQMIESAELALDEHASTDAGPAPTSGHPVRTASARMLRRAARGGLQIADKLDPTPQPA